MRQRSLFELYDLTRSESDSDTVYVKQTNGAAKRKRGNDNDRSNGKQRKIANAASARKSPQRAPVRAAQCSDDTIQVATRMRQPSRSRAKQASTDERLALGELSISQFQNQLQKPIAYYKQPNFDRQFLSQFARDVSPASQRPGSESSSPGRARRPTPKKAYIASSSESSDNELARPASLRTREKPAVIKTLKATQRSRVAKAVKSRKKNRDTSSDSEFVADDADDVEDDIEASELSVHDSSSVQSETEDDMPKKKTKAKSQPKSSTKSTHSEPQTVQKPASRKTSKEMVNLMKMPESTAGAGLDLSLPPVSNIHAIFQDLTSRAREIGFDKAIHSLKESGPLRVATMCSGTESPLLALEMIRDCVGSFRLEHLFSAELVPFKQAYIERNFNPPIIFRDITELIGAFKSGEQPMATTAYGAKVPVPVIIDILIAGTSCVDYSGMNSRRKGIHDGGESGDTWRAVLDFCVVARPAIVLIENVRNAPWDDMLQEYRYIGYECTGALVDTRNHYLPHIRQRGYMACFDKSKMEAAGVSKATSQWESIMAKLRRPASSPVSDFLLPNDRIERQQFRSDEVTREVDWETCAIRQMQYRQERRLGNARPITHWSESGSMQPPDNGHLQWYQRQVERVLDTIDAANLRKALLKSGMYDTRFKTRVIDLSQNVDREQDHRAFGMVGCITPSGMFFVSDAGRPLTAEETLALQGLPLDRISFTTESPHDVQDLAGNAMSTTVIGTSILSALLACHPMFRGNGVAGVDFAPSREDTASQRAQPTKMRMIKSCTHSELPPSRSVLSSAERSLRRCYCEGSNGMTTKAIQQCSDCGHTTCVACGGNPIHRYESLRQSNVRLSPVQFEQELRSILPLRVSLVNDVQLDDLLDNDADPRYCKALISAISKPFSFARVRRTHCWTVVYRSGGASLELAIETEACAEWRLFAHPVKELPGNDKMRMLLKQPVARCRLELNQAKDSLLGGDWEVREPRQRSVSLTINASGPKIASWWSRNQMPDFKDHFVWETLTIEAKGDKSLNGTYHHLPRCGMACDSLYKKVDDYDQPLYLFLDPTAIGNPDEDCFVFSHNKARLENDEVRSLVARVESSWRAWSQDGKSLGIAETTRTNLVRDVWRPCSTRLRVAATDLKITVPSTPDSLAGTIDCRKATTLISCDLSTVKSERPDNARFFLDNSELFEAMRRQLSFDQWSPLQNTCPAADCRTCSPARPEVRWVLTDKGSIVPQEDPERSAEYERLIKSRPEALFVTQCDGMLDVLLNLQSLAHRASARLRQHCSQGSTISFSWRFTTKAADAFLFRPFRLLPTAAGPCKGEFGLTVDLFPKQRLALTWMRQQEQGIDFMLEEIEEAYITSLEWRATVKAQTLITVRGGICADHPGFGKTITSLALISSEWIAKGKSGILSEVQMRNSTPGLLPVAATLIICPAVLLKQWQSEIAEKLLDQRKVVSINTVADIAKHSITDFENAAIVLVNRTVFGKEEYAERLAAFAGVPGPATTSGRAFEHWLKSVLPEVPKHLGILDRGFGLKKLQEHLKKVYKGNLESEKFSMYVPSRRLRGQNYIAGKQSKKASTSHAGHAAPSTVDLSLVGKPLLEMFHFNRIMVDEFHQYEPKERAAISALKGDKRWGLSATPAMDDLYDIAQTAGLLNISLGIGSAARGIMKTKNARDLKKDMTSFEQFDMMRQLPSDSLHAHLYDTDQRFLDTFVRRNIMDFNEELVCHEHLVPVKLDTSHMAIYAEISQHLNSLDMRIRRTTKAQRTDADRQERLHNLIDDCLSAEEALSKAAAFPESDQKLDDLVTLREQQVKQLLGKLPEVMRASYNNEPVAFGHWRANRVDGGTYGDAETIKELQSILGSSVGAKKSLAVKAKSRRTTDGSDDNDDGGGEDTKGQVSLTGTKTKTAQLHKVCQRLLNAKRSARYLQNVARIHSMAKDEDLPGCDNIKCETAKVGLQDAGVSILCGHLVCRPCYRAMVQHGGSRCHADGCSESLNDTHLLWSQKLTKTDVGLSAKVRATTDLLRSIKARGDQAIVFVQFEEQLDQISNAMEQQGIDAIVVKNAKDAGNQVEEFCSNGEITTLVLNASDETAAGLNLQNANHVIFLSPLLRDTQYAYEATMAQAVGRVRRYGQKKTIHIHRICALNTIDVDILEHRERRSDALAEKGARKLTPPGGAVQHDESGRAKKEKTQLVRDDEGRFSLRPRSWLVRYDDDMSDVGVDKVQGKNRVLGWEDFSSLVKFSKTFTEDDEW